MSSSLTINLSILWYITRPIRDDPREMDALSIYRQRIREGATDPDCTPVPVHPFRAGRLADRTPDQADPARRDARLPGERGHEGIAGAIPAARRRMQASAVGSDGSGPPWPPVL